MAKATFTLPRQWEDWANWLIGVWLCLSPWTLQFHNEGLLTRNAVIVGLLIVFMEVVTLSVFRAWEEWINVALGAWLVLSAWILPSLSTAARSNFIVTGILVAALALYEIRDIRRRREI